MRNTTAEVTRHVVDTLAEAESLHKLGWKILCEWKSSQPAYTLPGEVVKFDGKRVLVSHWGEHWLSVNDFGCFRLVAYKSNHGDDSSSPSSSYATPSGLSNASADASSNS